MDTSRSNFIQCPWKMLIWDWVLNFLKITFYDNNISFLCILCFAFCFDVVFWSFCFFWICRADPFAKKDWYDIKAPSIFQVKNVGKTLVSRTQGDIIFIMFFLLIMKIGQCIEEFNPLFFLSLYVKIWIFPLII